MAICVGIDPGVNTGLAVWDTAARAFLDIRCSGIVDAMEYLRQLQAERQISLVVFEDARQRKWIPRERNESQYRGRLMGAGSVKRDATVWQEFCEDNGIPFTARAPQKGMTKWSPQSFASVTGWTGRTSEHARDAALLVFGR